MWCEMGYDKYFQVERSTNDANMRKKRKLIVPPKFEHFMHTFVFLETFEMRTFFIFYEFLNLILFISQMLSNFFFKLNLSMSENVYKF